MIRQEKLIEAIKIYLANLESEPIYKPLESIKKDLNEFGRGASNNSSGAG